jgi:hypothetical protein
MRRKPSFYDIAVDSEHYESLEHYRPLTSEFVDRVRALLPARWRSRRRGPWFGWHPPNDHLPLQGWKIHVASTIANAAATLDAIVPVCAARNVSFKHAIDGHILAMINGKNGSREQGGKFVTIYPHDRAEFMHLLDELAAATDAFDGPTILTDRRYGLSRVVQYRYGGIAPVTRVDVTGRHIAYLVSPDGHLVHDERRPEFHLPPWVSDPFPQTEIEDDGSEASLNAGRYVVRFPLDFSNAGGIYVADDRTTSRSVIIKEARPHIGTGSIGTDAVDTLRNEWAALTALAGLAVAPEPIDLFRDWEHWFLVEEHVEGLSLTRHSAVHSIAATPEPSAEKAARFWAMYRTIFGNIAHALDVVHAAGFVFGDLSSNNVIVHSDTLAVRLIDLETVHAVGAKRVATTFTPGFAPVTARGLEPPSPDRDRYALGAMMLRYLLPMATLVSTKPELLDRFLVEWRQDFDLPADIEFLIRGLLAAKPSRRPTARVVHRALSEATDMARPAPALAGAAPHVPLPDLVRGGVRYILSVASFDRHDRLFPSSPALFETNPLSVAFGACGVAHVLQRVAGECPRPVVKWIAKHRTDAGAYGPGLYSGLAGIAWTLHDLGLEDEAFDTLRQAIDHPRLFDCAGLFNGASGAAMAGLALFVKSGDRRCLDYSRWCAEEILARAQTRGDGLCWLAPDGRVYYGLCHGASGVALFLLYLHLATKEPRWLEAGRRALAFDLAAIGTNDRFLWPYGEDTSPVVLPYVEFGAAGVGAAVLRYHLVTRHERYRTVLRGIVDDAAHKYAAFPGYLMGLAGLGQFFVDVAVLEGDEHAWTRAQLAVDGVRLFAIEKETGYAFPAEHHYRLGCDFATGGAGALLFLDNVVRRQTSSFMLDDLLPQRAVYSTATFGSLSTSTKAS